MTPSDRILAAKAAQDNGWEIPPTDAEDRLQCASARFDAVAWVSRGELEPFRIDVSSGRLLRELQREYPAAVGQGPGVGGVLAGGIEVLDVLMGRAARLARALPDNAAREYRERLESLRPDSTEVERVVRQRVGQDLFRGALLDYWGHACAVTGLTVPALLRASHAKPWAACENDEERLDVFNGFLLAPHLDALFDGGWVTFDDAGELVLSPRLSRATLEVLGLSERALRLRWIEADHVPYLAYHREYVFEKRL